MKKNITDISIILILINTLLFCSCDNNANKSNTSISESINTSTDINTEGSAKQASEGLPAEFLGIYHGIQPSYFMKNQYGDDMVINGNKVPVPSIDYKFLIKENSVVSLQQINLVDGSRIYYEGSYKIIYDDANTFKIECSLSDGEGSKPIYTLSLSKMGGNSLCFGSNEPEFSIEKLNNDSNSDKNSSSSFDQTKQSEEIEIIDGVYTYEDNSASITININGNIWSGKTIMITGLGSEYDNQNAEFEAGIVKGNNLYDNSGMVQIGYVNGKYLTTSIGGQQVRLRK